MKRRLFSLLAIATVLVCALVSGRGRGPVPRRVGCRSSMARRSTAGRCAGAGHVQGRGRHDRRHDQQGRAEHVPLPGAVCRLRARVRGPLRHAAELGSPDPQPRLREGHSPGVAIRTGSARRARSTATSARSPTQSLGAAGNFWDEARRTKWLDDFAAKPEARARPSRTARGTSTGSSPRAAASAPGSTASPAPTSRTTRTPAASSVCRSTPSRPAKGRTRCAGGTSGFAS